MKPIYFDNNATTRLSPAVAEAMADCLNSGAVNPASSHQMGQGTRRKLESARRKLAEAVGAKLDVHPPDRLLLTSGATESNHLAIRSYAAQRPGAIVVSSLEHPSAVGAGKQLAEQGREVRTIRSDRDGRIDLNHLESLLAPPVAVVVLMAANNETGVIQPLAEAVAMAHQASAPLHCDAVQAIGKMEFDFRASDIDSLSFNAHKIHGPVGIGALAVRAGVELVPLMRGGEQQLGTRPGTESLLLATGFATAAEQWIANRSVICERLGRQRDQLERQLIECGGEIHGRRAERIPTTISVSFPGVDRQELLLALDMNGLACSTGSACASGSSEPSPVLTAMGLPDAWVESAIRLSLAADTSEADILNGGERIARVVEQLRTKSNHRA